MSTRPRIVPSFFDSDPGPNYAGPVEFEIVNARYHASAVKQGGGFRVFVAVWCRDKATLIHDSEHVTLESARAAIAAAIAVSDELRFSPEATP